MTGTFDRPVTVWNLITHTGGFDQIGLDRQVREFDLPLDQRKAMRPSLREFLAAGNLRRVTEPGLMFRYDTYGITLAGLVIEQVTGKSYAEAMRDEMFTPLGMAHTSVEVSDESRPNLATGYGRVNDTFVAQPYEVYVTTPASSVDATAADMGRLLQALTGDGANANGRFLSANANAAATSPQFTPPPGFVGVSHGFQEAGWPVHAFEHGGSMLGFTSKLVVIPEFHLGYFVAVNRDGEAGGGPVHIGDELIFPILKLLPEPSAPKSFEVPRKPVEMDVSRYAGAYGSGVNCRTCTAEEFARDAWRQGGATEVKAESPGVVSFYGKHYVSRGEGLFVRQDGRRLLLFGTDSSGAVVFAALSDSPQTSERRDD